MEMNPREAEAVQELKIRVSDIVPKFKRKIEQHDMSVLRFLRARELNLNKAETMLRSYARWREQNHIDDIQEAKVPIHFYDDFPVKVCGLDKDGYMVGAAQIGKWDFRSMLEAGMKEEFIRFVVQWIERAIDIVQQLTTDSKWLCQACLILDFEGFQYRQLASKKAFVSLVIELVSVFEANYPEVLRSLWIINAPAIFSALWGIVKPFLTERTRSKIRIFGNNKNKWRPDILAMIDEDTLPSVYGGANTCCPDFDIDTDIDIKKFSQRVEAFPLEAMHNMHIPAGELFTLEVQASCGTQINWNFATQGNDISFRVAFEGEDVVKQCRVDSNLFIQKGRISVETSGLYTLVFDNTYSSYRGKDLQYILWTS